MFDSTKNGLAGCCSDRNSVRRSSSHRNSSKSQRIPVSLPFENLRFETHYYHNYTIAAFTIGYFIFHLPNESKSMSNEIQISRRGELAKY